MNYLAFCAAGKDHPVITREQRAEFGQNARRLGEQEHLKPEVGPTARKPGGERHGALSPLGGASFVAG